MVQLMQLSPIIYCSVKMHNGLTFLVLAYPGCRGKEAVSCLSLFRQVSSGSYLGGSGDFVSCVSHHAESLKRKDAQITGTDNRLHITDT